MGFKKDGFAARWGSGFDIRCPPGREFAALTGLRRAGVKGQSALVPGVFLGQDFLLTRPFYLYTRTNKRRAIDEKTDGAFAVMVAGHAVPNSAAIDSTMAP